MSVIKGASNGNELLLFFEQAFEKSRPDSSVLLERGDTWITVHSVAEERDMIAEYGINRLFQPPYFTHLNNCELCLHLMKAFSRGSLFPDPLFSLQRSSGARMEMKTAGKLLANPRSTSISVSWWIRDSSRHCAKLTTNFTEFK